MLGRAPNTQRTNTYGGRSCLPLTHTLISWELEVQLLKNAVCYWNRHFSSPEENKKGSGCLLDQSEDLKNIELLAHTELLNCWIAQLHDNALMYYPKENKFHLLSALERICQLYVVLDIKAKSPNSGYDAVQLDHKLFWQHILAEFPQPQGTHIFSHNCTLRP